MPHHARSGHASRPALATDPSPELLTPHANPQTDPDGVAVLSTFSGADIDNGLFQLGINPEGDVNLPDAGQPWAGTGTTTVGLRYVPENTEVLGHALPISPFWPDPARIGPVVCLDDCRGAYWNSSSAWDTLNLEGGLSTNTSTTSFAHRRVAGADLARRARPAKS